MAAKKYPDTKEKNITQIGDCSFRVRIKSGGIKADKVFDDLVSAVTYRNGLRYRQATDPVEAKIHSAAVAATFNKTVGDGLRKYLAEVTPRKKGAKDEAYRIGKILRDCTITNRLMQSIGAEDIDQYQDEIGGSENNRRKYLSIISHLYSTAARRKDWRWPVTNPITDRYELPSNGKPRERRLHKRNGVDEYQLLLDAFAPDPEFQSAFVIAVETAMRQSEQLNLMIEDINVTGRTAKLWETKNGEPRNTIFSRTAMSHIKKLIGERKTGRLFNFGKSQLRKKWEDARAAIGAPDLHWHDLRHEGTSRLFEKGLNVKEVQLITGHKTLTELMKYVQPRHELILDKLDAAN